MPDTRKLIYISGWLGEFAAIAVGFTFFVNL